MVRFDVLAFASTAFAFAGSSNAVLLDEDNFVEMTKGKTVFIKFFAPWCGHCKAMAPDWEKLTKDFKDHEVALIGEVDCTSDKGDAICEDFQIEGFPTILWGDASGAESYDGNRDYGSLKHFADEFVTKPVCSIFRLDACSQEEKKIIADLESEDDETLVEKAETITKLAKEAEDIFDQAVDKLQEEFEKANDEFNSKLESIKKEHNFKFREQVMKKRNLKVPPKDLIPDDDDDLKDEL